MRSMRRLLPWLIGLLCLALLIGGIYIAGGFKERSFRIDTVPNEPIDVGPATLWVESGTVRRDTIAKDKWEVLIDMKCQLNLQDSVAGGGVSFALTNYESVQVGDMSTGTLIRGTKPYLRIGSSEKAASNSKSDLSPGLPPQPCRIEFEMPDEYQPKDSLRMVIFKLEYRDRSYVNSTTFQDKSWLPGESFYRLDVPIKVAKK